MKAFVLAKLLELPLATAAEASLPLATLFDGLDASPDVPPYHRLAWNDFATLTNRLAIHLGDDLECFVEKAMRQQDPYQIFMRIGGLLSSPQSYFWMANKLFAPLLFPPVQVTERYLSKNRLEIIADVHPELVPADGFFRISAKTFEIGPTLMGMQPALVRHRGDGHHAVFTIDLPPSLSLFSRLRRMIDGALSTRQFMEELVLQSKSLEASFQALQQSEKSFRNLVENSPDPILIHGHSGIIFVNQALLDLLGYDDHHELLRTHIDHLYIQPTSQNQSPALRHKDGLLIPVDPSQMDTTFQGEPVTLLILRDLRLRNELIARALEMDRLITTGTLTASISHEINNPLTLVSTNLDLLHEQLHDLLLSDPDHTTNALHITPDELTGLQESLQGIESGTERALQITREIKDAGRKTEIDVRPVDLRDALQGALRLFRAQIKAPTTLVEELHPCGLVQTDLARVQQVVLNLLINAHDAVNENAPDQLREIRASTTKTDSLAIIEIHDTGPGIPPELREQIFDPFVTTKPPGKGTGLGLFVSRDIITRHHGTLTLDSTPGQGTTARIAFPLL